MSKGRLKKFLWSVWQKVVRISGEGLGFEARMPEADSWVHRHGPQSYCCRDEVTVLPHTMNVTTVAIRSVLKASARGFRGRRKKSRDGISSKGALTPQLPCTKRVSRTLEATHLQDPPESDLEAQQNGEGI